MNTFTGIKLDIRALSPKAEQPRVVRHVARGAWHVWGAAKGADAPARRGHEKAKAPYCRALPSTDRNPEAMASRIGKSRTGAGATQMRLRPESLASYNARSAASMQS